MKCYRKEGENVVINIIAKSQMFTLTDCYDVHLWLLSVGDICAVLKIYCQKYCLQGKIQIMDNVISEMEVEWKFSQSLLERKAVLFQLNNSLSF